MRSFLLWIVLGFCFHANALDSLCLREHSVTAQLTLSEGFSMAKSNAGFRPYYLHGSADYYLKSCFSVGGDMYAQVGYSGVYTSSSIFIAQQYNLFFGGAYHWHHGMNDLSFGIQPGLGVSMSSLPTERDYVFSPLFSTVLNYNLWMSPYFRLFMQGRLVAGTHMSSREISLTETRASAGLAFALPRRVKIGAH